MLTHCRAGHEFTPENTYVRPDRRRECIACKRLRDGARKRAAGVVYIGNPCYRCGGTERYACNQSCVACEKARATSRWRKSKKSRRRESHKRTTLPWPTPVRTEEHAAAYKGAKYNDPGLYRKRVSVE
jgi:hypothetical protein